MYPYLTSVSLFPPMLAHHTVGVCVCVCGGGVDERKLPMEHQSLGPVLGRSDKKEAQLPLQMEAVSQLGQVVIIGDCNNPDID